MQKNRIKRWIFLFSLLIVCFLLVSCQTGASTGGSSKKIDTAAKDKTVLSFWTIDLKANFKDYFENLISKYETAHPDITIDWTDVTYDDIVPKLQEAIRKNQAPDVVNLNTQMALSMAGQNQLLDVNTVLSEQQKAIYTDSLWDSARMGDQVYALPWYASPDIMFVNGRLLQQAGLTTTPVTMDEALAMAPRFHKATGAYLFTPDELFYLLLENNIPILNEDRTKAAFNTEETAELLKRYKVASDAGVIPKSIWGSWDDTLALYESSKLATISSSGSSLNILKEDAPYMYRKTGIAHPLVGSSGFSRNSLMNLVIPSASKNQAAAVDFAAFVTNDDNQLAFCKLVPIFPSTEKAGADPYFTSDMATLEGRSAAMSAKASETSRDFSLGVENQDEIQYAVNEIYESFIVLDDDLKPSLDRAEQKVNEILAGNVDGS